MNTEAVKSHPAVLPCIVPANGKGDTVIVRQVHLASDDYQYILSVQSTDSNNVLCFTAEAAKCLINRVRAYAEAHPSEAPDTELPTGVNQYIAPFSVGMYSFDGNRLEEELLLKTDWGQIFTMVGYDGNNHPSPTQCAVSLEKEQAADFVACVQDVLLQA